uniref:FLYWCH-type domain-containing protein n=1 Tax=Panagrolaimus davidi TaxID=227884 RepID=A0A914P0R1_9BILA
MKKGKSVKELYVFTTEERKYYYRFTYSNYCCTGCEARRQIVTARLFKDKNGTECIRMGINKHVCKPQLYEPTAADFMESEGKNSESAGKSREPKVPVKLIETESEPKNKENQHKSTKSVPKAIEPICDKPSINAIKLNTEYELELNATEFTFVPSELGYTPRLIIFAKNDKTLCYEFSSSSTAFHYCTGCSKLNNNLPNLYVRIQKNAKNEDIILTKNEKHICKPIKFDPSKCKSPTTIKPSNYMFYKNSKGSPKMIIFASKDKKLCYNYNLVNRDKIWYCSECTKQKKLISAKVRIDFDDEEYVQLGNAGHVCKPLKYSSLKSVIIEIVKSTDVIIPKRIEGKGNILTEPFELRTNKDGIKDQILIIFASNEKKQCYIFEYTNSSKSYYCKNCLKENSYVSAKICEKDKKKYVMLGQKKHICKPVKYDSLK